MSESNRPLFQMIRWLFERFEGGARLSMFLKPGKVCKTTPISPVFGMA